MLRAQGSPCVERTEWRDPSGERTLMEQWNALPLSRKLLLGAGLLLLIDTFFAWQKVSVGIGGVEIASAKANGWHGFFGVVMGLLTIALLAWVIARALGVQLPP